MFTKCLALLLFPLAARAAPMEFTHSGRLLDTDGQPLNTTTVSITVELWTQQSNGTKIWEDSFQPVNVEQGYFQVVLGTGSGPELDSALFADGRAAYLQVVVDNSIMGGRMALTGVPYAAHAESAGSVPPTAGLLTCDADSAGRLWHQEVGDNAVVQICAKTNSVYAWSALFGGTPGLSSLSATTGVPGLTITVAGSNFTPGATTATLDGYPLSIASLTPTGFTFEAPMTPPGEGRDLTVTDTNSGATSTYVDAWTNSAPLPTGGTVTVLIAGGNTYRLHAFASVGSLGVFDTDFDLSADVLVAAGGAGGGISTGNQDTGKGGGGAGGLLRATDRAIAAGIHTMTVGAGGAGAAQGIGGSGAQGNDGGDSIAFGGTSLGGGGGGRSDSGSLGRGRDGGSAGGGAARSTTYTGGTATQNSPAGWTGYGSGGGDSIGNANYGGGGGGGAGGPGQNASDAMANRSRGGNGGGGVDFSATFGTDYGETGWFGGGGGGGTRSFDPIYGQSSGGLGGGGDGNCGSEGSNIQCANINAMPNSGGGGGGAVESPSPGQYCSDAAGAGGSGLILIRYPYQP
jgi:hypothetical protein